MFLKQSFQILDHLNYQNNFWRSGITEASMKSDTKLELLLFAQNRIEQERVYQNYAIEQSLIGTQTIQYQSIKQKTKYQQFFYLKTSLV